MPKITVCEKCQNAHWEDKPCPVCADKPVLPRLLEDGRIEVRLGINGTHVYELSGIDALIAHLNEARKLLTGQDALTAAKSRGREAGLREAAEVARNACAADCPDGSCDNPQTSCNDCISERILSRLPSPAAVEIEGCEWTQYGVDPAAFQIGCKKGVIFDVFYNLGFPAFKFCPYCGKRVAALESDAKPIITAS